MKIIYNDRKRRLNWGARSTGKALYQLLLENHEIVADFDTPSPTFSVPTKSKFDMFSESVLEKYNFRIFRILLNKLRRFVPNTLLQISEVKVICSDVNKTADNIMKYRGSSEFLKKIVSGIERADALIINGEGTMIFGNPTRYDLFFFFALIKIAKDLGKKTFYINAIASENPVTGFNKDEFNKFRPYFSYCDKIAVRDTFSMEFLKKHGIETNVIYCPDSLFTWSKYIENGLEKPYIGDLIIPFPDEVTDYGVFDFSEPYICIGGSSHFLDSGNPIEFKHGTDYYHETVNNYILLVDKLKELKMKLYFVESCDRDSFLYEVSKKTGIPVIPSRINLVQAISILASANVFISGRYHPSIMASLGGTPCIFMNSNSHKTFSLQFLLGYDKPKVYSPELTKDEIESIYNDCKLLLLNQDSVRKQIRYVVKKLSVEASKIEKTLNMSN